MSELYEIHSELLTDREHTACFTGHRPDNIPFIGDEVKVRILKSMLHASILRAIDDGYTTFITGMAVGVDLWAGHMVGLLKKDRPELGLKLIGFSPYKGSEKGLVGQNLYDYGTVRDECDEYIQISEHYYKGCFQARNVAMVNFSSLIIGAVASYSSGTGNTIRAAKGQNLKMDIIDLKNSVIFGSGK